ncbi:MAG: Hemolysins and related proteins containing CBS domains [uncultured Rubrobacteraceae bacterium]|uniref:Hemolysins and related proteins containing CBS domains n=1 Tax=uncultured Rubrobacteraceae bacterium TaxID=349277 RepID=A0A6J4QK83_9ACTN|nr:MAG: Hemolysins and related proteins containing CBS domains [uncultured Rubrobacteraceae bacterium]
MDGVVLSSLGLFAALFFVALNGLFVSAEFSFVKIRATQVERLVQEGRASAKLVQTAIRKLDAYLAVCQLGITISSLSLGALGEPAIASLIEPLLNSVLPENFIHAVAFGVGFLIITSLHVILGELVPKSVGIQRPEGTSLFIAPFMRAFYYLFLPLTIIFNGAGNAIVRAFGVLPASETEEMHSEIELRTLISQSTRQGALQKRDEDMLEGVFELGETVAREIMVPRPDVVTLPSETPLGQLARVTVMGNYTRYPLFEGENVDQIIGAVHVKDILQAAEAAGSFEADVVARDLMRELITVPENRLIEDVLAAFQRRRIHMAVVIDEWGSFSRGSSPSRTSWRRSSGRSGTSSTRRSRSSGRWKTAATLSKAGYRSKRSTKSSAPPSRARTSALPAVWCWGCWAAPRMSVTRLPSTATSSEWRVWTARGSLSSTYETTRPGRGRMRGVATHVGSSYGLRLYPRPVAEPCSKRSKPCSKIARTRRSSW